MDTRCVPTDLPPPDVVQGQIFALEDELKALRRLFRASKAAAAARAARERREAIRSTAGNQAQVGDQDSLAGVRRAR